jgi:hypothetical protein
MTVRYSSDFVIQDYHTISWDKRIHQFILNLTGASVGWIIIYLFLAGKLDISNVFGSILLASITFISLTGYLPYIVTKFGPFGK